MPKTDAKLARVIAKKLDSDEKTVLSIMREIGARDPVGFDRVAAVLGNPWAWVAGVVMLWADGRIPKGDWEKLLIGGLVPA